MFYKPLTQAKKYIAYTTLILTCIILYRCASYKTTVKNTTTSLSDTLTKVQTDTLDFSVSKVLSAAQSMNRMQLESGYEVKLVAAEPLISTPVAITFDNTGRIWAVEMSGYMPDTLGTGEDEPTGKVVILTDDNHDGLYDRRNVFIDSLRLPRAICLIDKGILVAEPPNLWYYEINGDKPGKRTLVDPKYTEEGNVEHYPNGLLRALDNWIYNAKSAKRYRKIGDKWLIEKTHFRGQWGISQDNEGRLYYNDNSSNVIGDYFLPGFGSGNGDQHNVAGYNERIVADNRVYPVRPTPGINRGYTPGMLDSKQRLVNFTAACAPLVYRGGLFGQAQQDVFVAEPSANLIKRNVITQNGYITQGKQAYKDKEFLASTDERFRPVNLNDGPDGALYITDMYRGIIQHKTYLTGYLKNEIAKRQLSQPLNCGRIYKVIPKGSTPSYAVIPTDAGQLVALLGSANGWLRDRAQQIIIDNKITAAIPALKQALTGNNTIQIIHALWTLEGLHAVNDTQIQALLNNSNPVLRIQALSVIPSVISKTSYKTYVNVLQKMIALHDDAVAPYLAFVYPDIAKYDKAAADDLLKKLALQYAGNKYVADAVLSNLAGREARFQTGITDTSSVLSKRLAQVIKSRNSRLHNNDANKLKKTFPRGAKIFSSTCQTCHGADGNGIKGLAPPFNRSQWITGDKRKLIAIVLHGLTGPVEVNNHLYKSPEINGDMPGIGGAQEIGDEDIAQVLSFLRRSWQNNATTVNAQEVGKVRNELKTRDKAFTVEDLEKLYPATTDSRP